MENISLVHLWKLELVRDVSGSMGGVDGML